VKAGLKEKEKKHKVEKGSDLDGSLPFEFGKIDLSND
jgi:hypothetical protein